MPEYGVEVLRALYRITEWKDGCVYKTKFIRNVWINPDERVPAGHILASPSTSYEGPTIRRVKLSD